MIVDIHSNFYAIFVSMGNAQQENWGMHLTPVDTTCCGIQSSYTGSNGSHSIPSVFLLPPSISFP